MSSVSPGEGNGGEGANASRKRPRDPSEEDNDQLNSTAPSAKRPKTSTEARTAPSTSAPPPQPSSEAIVNETAPNNPPVAVVTQAPAAMAATAPAGPPRRSFAFSLKGHSSPQPETKVDIPEVPWKLDRPRHDSGEAHQVFFAEDSAEPRPDPVRRDVIDLTDDTDVQQLSSTLPLQSSQERPADGPGSVAAADLAPSRRGRSSSPSFRFSLSGRPPSPRRWMQTVISSPGSLRASGEVIPAPDASLTDNAPNPLRTNLVNPIEVISLDGDNFEPRGRPLDGGTAPTVASVPIPEEASDDNSDEVQITGASRTVPNRRYVTAFGLPAFAPALPAFSRRPSSAPVELDSSTHWSYGESSDDDVQALPLGASGRGIPRSAPPSAVGSPAPPSGVLPSSEVVGTKECAICLDLLVEQPLASAVCGHVFHKTCIDQVVKTQAKCPVCRRRLSPTEVHPIFL